MAKDSRITVWTNPSTTVTGTTTLNGPDIDLFGSNGNGWSGTASSAPAGGTYDGTSPDMGIGVEIIQSTASGTGQVTSWNWQIAPDNSGSPGTYVTHSFIGTATMSAANTVVKLRTTMRSRYRWARLQANSTGVGTSTVNAYADDMAGVYSTGAAR